MDKLLLTQRRLLIYQWSRLLPFFTREEALNENCVLENMAEQSTVGSRTTAELVEHL